MRQVIKRVLLYVARLALFFSVMAWVIGQWRLLNYQGTIGSGPFFGASLFCTVAATGYRFGVCYGALRPPEWNISIDAKMDNEGLLFDSVQIVPGVSAYWDVGGTWVFTVHHWLCITITILSYFILRCVYRRRPDLLDACDPQYGMTDCA